MAIAHKDDTISVLEKEVRIDQFYRWLKKNMYLLTILGCLLIGFSAFYAWNINKAEKLNKQASKTYAEALFLLKENKKQEAFALLSTIAQKNSYGAFAALKRGSLLMDEGKKEEVLLIFDTLAKNSDINDPALHDLSAIIALYASENENNDASSIIQSGNIFHFFAVEIEALALLKAQKKEEAATLFSQLVQNDDVPSHIKGRARGWLESLSFPEQKDNSGS